MTSLNIRMARPGDEAALSRISRRTFTETFGHLYPPEDLAHFLETSHDEAGYAAELADTAYGLWLVEADGEAVGYAQAGPCALPHAEARESDGEVKRIYLLKAWQGGGTGGRLLAEVLDWLERDGPRPLWIGVYFENFGAQRLYARHGFEKVGEYEFIVGRTRDPEFILRRRAAVTG